MLFDSRQQHSSGELSQRANQEARISVWTNDNESSSTIYNIWFGIHLSILIVVRSFKIIQYFFMLFFTSYVQDQYPSSIQSQIKNKENEHIVSFIFHNDKWFVQVMHT